MAATDNFSGFKGGTYPHGLDAPAMHAAAVTPSDSTDLASATRGLYVGTGGDVKVNTSGGETGIVFTAVPGGTVLPIRVTRVLSTGTTASNIVALW